MKPSTRDEIRDKFQDVKGQLEEKAGQLANDSNLQAQGQAEKSSAAKVERGIAKTAEMHGEFAPDLGKE